MLDDTMKIQCQNSEIFLQNIFSNWTNHLRLKKPKSPGLCHNDFIIRHFSSDVQYNAVGLTKFWSFFAKTFLLPISNLIYFM